MRINIRADSVEIEGYVNAVERDSKPLLSRIGRFVERICKGAFKRALERNDNVLMLLNHDEARQLANTRDSSLELHEDAIGLHARATVTDSDVIEKARNGDLVGWSFGFTDRPDGVVQRFIDGILHRDVSDLNLIEVSILDSTKTPAYDGTLVMARSEEDVQYRSEAFIDDIETTVEEDKPEEAPKEEETREEPKQQEAEKIDYSEYETIISKMKGD